MSKIAIIDPPIIEEIAGVAVTKTAVESVLTGEISSHTHAGGGSLTLETVKADTDIASAISLKHSSGSDNQDLSGLQPKETGKGLYPDNDASKLSGITAGAQVNADITKAEIEAKLTGSITSHSHAGGGGMNLLKKTADQTINAGAGVFTDITDLTFPVVSGVDYAFYFYITFRSAATTTGWRAGVNCPSGALDFWAKSDVIANGAAGVTTHTERHNTVRDDMTLLTATITQAVDLSIEIRGRYLCTANGTFAARFANELASNTQIVVQKGSWGYWF